MALTLNAGLRGSGSDDRQEESRATRQNGLPDTLDPPIGEAFLIDQESELDRLYTAPLDQFIKLRNEFAGRLRKDGNEAAAARIGRLKKPSVSAWAVNQLARTADLDVQRLIKAGVAQEQAQRSALSGGLGGFEAARVEEAAAIRLLREAARKLLPSTSTVTLDRVTKTLRAAAATPEGRVLLKQGRLTEDLEPPGFDAFSGIGTTQPAVSRAPSMSAAQKKRLSKIETLLRQKQEADETADRLDNEARDLERKAREAEALAKRASRAAETARQRADAAAAKGQSLEAELKKLEGG